jgi:Pro-kumamolisin, activation domain
VNKPFTGSAYIHERAPRENVFPRAIRDLRRALAQFRRTTTLAGALLLFAPLGVFAQSSALQPRITAQISESRLMTLQANTHPLARAQYDQGRVDPSLKIERITILFQQTAAQKADLDALLAAQQNPTSPSFHQWLTPAQFGDRFGIAQADLQKVTAWLQGHGLTIVETPESKNFLVFDGTAAQVESAFHLEMHNYATSDRKFYANSGEPSVPASLFAVVAGFRGLNNYRLKPRSIQKHSLSGIPQPNFTSAISGNHFVAPGDFAEIYDLNPLYSIPIDGTGQKIVIVGQSNIVLADIASFRTASGLPPNVPIVTLVPTSTDPGVLNSTGDDVESSIDIEWSGAVARNATIHFVYSGNGVFDAFQYAVSQNYAPVISISYGGCEPTFSSSDIDALVAIAQQANSQGITIVSSVGDGGATDCDGSLGNFPAILGLNVDVPGSLPYVTGVGGTEFNEGSGTYWTQANGTDVLTSALSYIPEQAWNDSSSANGLSAGGGGASSVFGKPTWQTGTGVPNDGARDVPDISLNASPAHDPYLFCSQFIPQGSTTFTSSCLKGTFRYSDNSLEAAGGTSFGAPTFAGIMALINQMTGSAGQGNVNYILYPLAASSSTTFHDVTTGNNTSPCQQGTQDCPNGGAIGFNAGTGYDQATGLGSIYAFNLVTAWSSISTGAGPTPTLSSINPTSISAGSAAFPLTATGSSFASNAQILWNGSTDGVMMQPGGTATSIKATISSALVAYGTIASVTVTDDAAKAGESSASQTFTVNGIPPVNDNIANAIAITSSNFTSTVDNSAATTESTDPTPPCASRSTNPRTKTVWWSLTSATSGAVTISTIGSVYDTTLSVWTGTPVSLTNVACNDDVSGGQYVQSLLSFSTTAGTKYYIMVAPFGPPDTGLSLLGGKTVLNVSNGNPSSLSAAPSSLTVSAGSPATYTVTDIGAISYVVTCSGLPKGASCGALTVPANSTSSLVMTTTSRTASAPPLIAKRRFHIDLWPGTLVMAVISIFILSMLGRRRVWGMIPVGTVALLLIFLVAGCGSSSSGGGTTVNPNGTPAGTYIITVTGTSGSTIQSTSVTLVVN